MSLKLNKRQKLIVINLLLCYQVILAQTKNEREERVDLSDFPEAAQQVLQQLPKTKRLKFYKETDGNIKSFEAKFKYKKRHYSLEFSTNGSIEDIEIIVKEQELPALFKSKIDTYFNANFSKTKLIKIQKQYVYKAGDSTNDFIKAALKNQSNAVINYEIIAEITEKAKRSLREFTFNSNGQFINSRTIILPSYGHVLY